MTGRHPPQAALARGLDHAVHAVRDLAAVKAGYEALGFTTTPPAMHPWGTGNSLVQLDGSFVEILSVEEPERIAAAGPGEFSFGAFNRDFLARGDGMSMMVFSSADAAADRARWQEQGLETYALFDFSRRATLPGGEQVTVAFSLAFVTDPAMPRAAWFVCQQHHPEHFWKPEYQRHANGAARMGSVWMQAPDPARHGDFLARRFAEGRVVEADGGVDLVLPRGRVALRTPEALAARFPGAPLPPAGAGPAFAALAIEGAGGPAQRHALAGLLVELG
jgi:hypothetical protein